jgi:hypothetical protein
MEYESTPSLLYRFDIREAVRIFRPVLRALKIRSHEEHPIVFFAAFEDLINLSLDKWSIQVLVAEIETPGIFFFKHTKQGSLRAFIVLKKMLYDNPKKEMKEILKTAGVHEFVHFLAIVYAVTYTKTIELRKNLLSKLQGVVQKLPGPELLTVYYGIKNKYSSGDISGYTDTHFRLDYEGRTPDYSTLFLHLMFSRELFEEYFNRERQRHFKELMKQNNNRATQLILESLNTAANDKDVPVELALSQLMEWVHVYTR